MPFLERIDPSTTWAEEAVVTTVNEIVDPGGSHPVGVTTWTLESNVETVNTIVDPGGSHPVGVVTWYECAVTTMEDECIRLSEP